MMNKLRWPLVACGCLILLLSAASSAAAQATEVDFKALPPNTTKPSKSLARSTHSRHTTTRRSACSPSDAPPMRARQSNPW